LKLTRGQGGTFRDITFEWMVRGVVC